jgi:hypothetical protein
MLAVALGALAVAVVALGSIATPTPDAQGIAATADQPHGVLAGNGASRLAATFSSARTSRPCQAQTWPFLERKCLRGASRSVRHVDRAPDGHRSGPRGDTLTEQARAAMAYALAPPVQASKSAAERRRSSRRSARRYREQAYDHDVPRQTYSRPSHYRYGGGYRSGW